MFPLHFHQNVTHRDYPWPIEVPSGAAPTSVYIRGHPIWRIAYPSLTMATLILRRFSSVAPLQINRGSYAIKGIIHRQ